MLKNASFGEGNDEIWLDQVNCDGIEDNIFQCRSRINSMTCQHNKDVGIRCANVTGLNILHSILHNVKIY